MKKKDLEQMLDDKNDHEMNILAEKELFALNKKKIDAKSYSELEKEWEKLIINKNEISRIVDEYSNVKSNLKLTISSVCLVTSLPKETVRRKIEALKKKKFITYSTKDGLLPTDKIEEAVKPFAEQELITLSKFLQALKKHKSLDPLLNLK